MFKNIPYWLELLVFPTEHCGRDTFEGNTNKKSEDNFIHYTFHSVFFHFGVRYFGKFVSFLIQIKYTTILHKISVVIINDEKYNNTRT